MKKLFYLIALVALTSCTKQVIRPAADMKNPGDPVHRRGTLVITNGN